MVRVMVRLIHRAHANPNDLFYWGESMLVRVTTENQIATLSLNRPDVRNCVSPQVIEELVAAATRADADPNVRVIVLQGEGAVFCAGADLGWMRDSVHASREQNLAEAKEIARVLTTLYALKKPLIARVHGAAIGLGVGLTAVADIAVAADNTQFGLAEVKLGIVPAVVGPYVIAKVGTSHARRYFISGERVDATTAAKIGLVHVVVPLEKLDAEITRLTASILTGGPNAVIAAKQLVRDLTPPITADIITTLTHQIADIRVTPEAQEGMTAFLEKRKPKWM